MSARSRRLTRFLVTAGPTARLTTNPTLAGSCRCRASSRTSRWPTTRGRPARIPVRTVSANSAPWRIRDWDGRIRHSAGRGPCACGRRGWRARPGCACAAGNHASSRGADCSAGTCAYSLMLQVGIMLLARWMKACGSRIHHRLPSGTPPFARRARLAGLRLWKAIVPPAAGVTVRSGDATCTTCGLVCGS